jgi:hypothetical protein
MDFVALSTSRSVSERGARDLRTKPALFRIDTYELCHIHYYYIELLDSPSQEICAILHRILNHFFCKREDPLELTGKIQDCLIVSLLLLE